MIGDEIVWLSGRKIYAQSIPVGDRPGKTIVFDGRDEVTDAIHSSHDN
jgi:hypothetical protein